MLKQIESDKCDSVTNEKVILGLAQFATLATRLDRVCVTTNVSVSHTCHACYTMNKDKLTESFDELTINHDNPILSWLAIAIEEGHLEPSQPFIGRLIGWPQREIGIYSLWVEFISWCYKQHIPKKTIPDQSNMCRILDKVFIRKSNKYLVPPLVQCRTNFNNLRTNERY